MKRNLFLTCRAIAVSAVFGCGEGTFRSTKIPADGVRQAKRQARRGKQFY